MARSRRDRTWTRPQRAARRWRACWRLPFWEGVITDAEMWEAIAHDGPMWLLSNHRTSWLLPRLERFGVADRFERILVSDVLAAAKPSAAAFAALQGRDDLIFYDDSQCNVDAARSFGIDAHLVAITAR